MKQELGWWFPDNVGGEKFVRRANEAMTTLEHVPPHKRRVAVQAGGHVGIVPALLSVTFTRVYTFEPEHNNFQCLVENTKKCLNLWKAQGVLGHLRGGVNLALGKTSGGHNVDSRGGPIPSYRIDDLDLDKCDAIFLDVNGYEMWALRGAMDTISTFRPLLVVEENKKCHGKGFEFGDIEVLLRPIGYKVVSHVDEDLVLVAK